MGLDVYRYTITNEEFDSTVILYPDSKNRSLKALFEHYKNHARDFVASVFDQDAFEKDFQGDGEITNIFFSYATRNPTTMSWEDWVEFCENSFLVITTSEDKTHFISREQYDSYYKPVNAKFLKVKQEYIQRKGLNEFFYIDYLKGRAITDEDWEIQQREAVEYIFTQQELDLVKPYCVSGLPLLSTELEENQFIYFSY